VTRLDRGSMTQAQLVAASKNPRETPRGSIRYLTEYHHRLVLPVGCFILSLLGMPLGLQAKPGKKAIGLPIGLALFVLYYIVYTVAQVMVEDLILPLIPGMWAPNVLFLLLTLYVFYRTENERTILPSFLEDFLTLLMERCISPVTDRIRSLARTLFTRRRRQTKDVQPEKDQSRDLLIHANGLSMVYHLPGCEFYDCENCTIFFISVEIAEQAGFKPCRFCRKHAARAQDEETNRP